MRIIGITISLAGKPKMKPNIIAPSRPKIRAKGFRKLAIIVKILVLLMVMLARR